MKSDSLVIEISFRTISIVVIWSLFPLLAAPLSTSSLCICFVFSAHWTSKSGPNKLSVALAFPHNLSCASSPTIALSAGGYLTRIPWYTVLELDPLHTLSPNPPSLPDRVIALRVLVEHVFFFFFSLRLLRSLK